MPYNLVKKPHHQKPHYLSNLFMRGGDARKYLEWQYGQYKTVLAELGLVK